MVRKTLSVGPDSWKALSAMGKFGMSFDDIIKILLIEHNELMRINGQKEIPLGPSIYKQSQEAQEQAEAEVQQQSQHQQEQQVDQRDRAQSDLSHDGTPNAGADPGPRA